MTFILYLSQLILPMTVFFILFYGILSHVPIYDTFIKGAEKGLKTVLQLTPTLIGLMIATGILRASGVMDLFAQSMKSLVSSRIFPAELLPLTLLRMFSSSAAAGLLLDIYKQFGPDSYLGTTASLMMCCTETIFYTMSVYFMAAHVKKTRFTLPGALITSFSGIAASIILSQLLSS